MHKLTQNYWEVKIVKRVKKVKKERSKKGLAFDLGHLVIK
jgi:hypothetical protein